MEFCYNDDQDDLTCNNVEDEMIGMESSNNCCKLTKYQWIDITPQFRDAVQDLEMGELLHDNLFGLFEAMSAIEMMDPKMDAGMICNRGSRKVKTLHQSLQEGILKLDGFENDQIIGLIDTTLACVVSWLEGHSLAQTVFTNLYLHKPYSIEDRTVKAFCLMVYKLLEIIKDFVHKAAVYEEEDFQPMQYGYHLNPDISEQRMIGMFREAEEDLHRKMRAKHPTQHDFMMVQAVYARMKFMRVFYQVLTLMRRDEHPIATGDCNRLLSTAHDMLLIMEDSVDLSVLQSTNGEDSMPGFEPLINQRLLPPTFPRYTKIKSRRQAIAHFAAMMERFKVITKVHSITSVHQMLDFFIEFSKSSPCLLSRSALQLIYHGANSSTLRDTLKEAVKSFICPPALVSKSLQTNSQAKKIVETFFANCSRPFANLFQLCGHNRARQRDKLAHLLEEFAALQEEAERFDAFLHNITVNSTFARPHLACFGTWILYHTLKIMIMYLLSGFELELYSRHEFYYIYWYLYEFLYGWLVSALSRADSFLVENELMNELQKPKGAGNKKKSRHKRKTRPYSKDVTYYQALQNLCGGYYKALMGFRMDGKLAMPHPQFDNEQVRYEHRFLPFQNLLTPPPVQYSEFREMTCIEKLQQQPIDSIYFYVTGCKHFHQARQLLEGLPQDDDILQLLKIAKTNFVVLKLLAGGHTKNSSESPNFEFLVNKYFPIIKIG